MLISDGGVFLGPADDGVPVAGQKEKPAKKVLKKKSLAKKPPPLTGVVIREPEEILEKAPAKKPKITIKKYSRPSATSPRKQRHGLVDEPYDEEDSNHTSIGNSN